jgi:hypothetical protein
VPGQHTPRTPPFLPTHLTRPQPLVYRIPNLTLATQLVRGPFMLGSAGTKAAFKSHSCRVRRKRQGLPSRLLIETPRPKAYVFAPTTPRRGVSIKPSDNSGSFTRPAARSRASMAPYVAV